MNCKRCTRAAVAACGMSMVVMAIARPCQAQAPSEPNPPQHDTVETLSKENADLKKRVEALERRLDGGSKESPAPGAAPESSAPRHPSPQEALDAALAGANAQSTSASGRPQDPAKDLLRTQAGGTGGATLRLIDISLVTDISAGWSSEKGQRLLNLQGGDHDPRRRGFTLQAAELGLAGAVDPYFTAQANINLNYDPDTGETNVELEEAFATTQSLPFGLQAKAGQYFTEFGLSNPTHPHTWDWLDQPVINTRLFTGDGMRGVGARLGWLTPLPWYSQVIVGVQNATGPQMGSFLATQEFVGERGIGGRPFVARDIDGLGDFVSSARWENSFETSDATTLKCGLSTALGPNSTGNGARTSIYGADFKFRWRPVNNEKGWPFVVWQGEVMARDYKADAFYDASDPSNIIDLPAQTLHDWGLYTQVLYGFTPGWAVGLRYDWASGSGDSVGGRANDPYRDNRQRLSPLIEWQVSEFSRLRLQYNHDITDHLSGRNADSFYFGFEFLYGAHPAHAF